MKDLHLRKNAQLLLAVGVVTTFFVIAIYNGIIAYRMSNSLKYDERGAKLMDVHHYAQAENELQIAVSYNPNYAGAHLHLGVALYQNGKIDASIKEFRRTLEITPDFSSVYYYLGNAINRKGQRNEARAMWQKVLTLPERPWAKSAQEQLDKYPQTTR